MSGAWPDWSGALGPLVPDDEVPESLRTLLRATTDLDPSVFHRLSPVPTDASRRAAVLMVFGAEPDVLLQLRADTLGAHAGQVSFPGGGAEPVDADPVATALREAEEEVGLAPSAVRPVSVLPPLYVPVSRFQVTPVLAHWVREQPVRAVDPAETVAVARIPLSYLVDPANRCSVRVRGGFLSPAFLVPGMLVWGFTAGLLSALLGIGGWEVGWDTSDVRELDDAWRAVRALPPLTGRMQA